MRIKYGLRNYVAILLMQWFVVSAGIYVIFASESGLCDFVWVVLLGALIPPIFTMVLYHIWFVDVEENGCMRFTGPLKKKRETLCLKDILEIEISQHKGTDYVKTIKDRESKIYPMERLLNRNDCEKMWKELSKHIKSGEYGIKVREV